MEIVGKLYIHVAMAMCNNVVNCFIRKNEIYLARFIPFFETQVGMDLNAEDLLTEIVRDNR